MRDHYTLARLYVPQKLQTAGALSLSQTQAHFLGTVMRKKIGDHVRVFNGEDGEWLAEIKCLSKRKAEISITKLLRPAYSPPDVWLLFAPVKKSRTGFIVEKATELGVTRIQPVLTARTTSTLKTKKMGAQIVEAAEQTERLDLPKICEPVKLQALLEGWDEGRTLIFADEAGEGISAAKALAKIQAPCAFLVGPEGGFTDDEREFLRSKSYVKAISLGPRILRADTAAVSVLSIWQAVSGDWQGRNKNAEITFV